MNEYNRKKVLVTGGAGFIGSHLTEKLVFLGAQVRVIDNLAQGYLSNLQNVMDKIEFIKGDVRDEQAVKNSVKGIDIVFHLAANASVPRSVTLPQIDFECNALGTFNLLNALRDSNVNSCVVISSGAVYGQPTRFPIIESENMRPISPYGASKMAAEALCFAFNVSYNLPTKIARVFNTYGPRQRRFVMYDFYQKLRENPNRLEILGNGRQVRDYCYVKDTVVGLLGIAKIQEAKCDVFNVASSTSYSVVNVADFLVELLGLDSVEYVFTGASWEGDAQRWEVSIEKLRQKTGFIPQFKIDYGIKQLVEWCDLNLQQQSKLN